MFAKGMPAAPEATLKNVSTVDHGSSITVKDDGNDFCVCLDPSEAVTACSAGHSAKGGAATAKPMNIEPEVIMYTDCNTIHLELSQPAVSGGKVSMMKADAENTLKTHDDPMKYKVCIDDERIQARETETIATTSNNQRLYPVSFPCNECGWDKSLTLFAPCYHNMYYNTKLLNMAYQVTAFNTMMKCRNCEGERVSELQCKGACHLLKALGEFTKEQRTLGTNLCMDCLRPAERKAAALNLLHIAATAPDNNNNNNNATHEPRIGLANSASTSRSTSLNAILESENLVPIESKVTLEPGAIHLEGTGHGNTYKNKSDAEKNDIIASLIDTIAEKNKTIITLKEAMLLEKAGQAHDELTQWLNSVKPANHSLPKKTLLNAILDFSLRDLYTIIRHRLIPHNLHFEHAYRTLRSGATQLKAVANSPKYILNPATNTLERTNTSTHSAADTDNSPFKSVKDAERKLAHMNKWPMYPAKQARSIDDLEAEVDLHRDLANQYQAAYEQLKKAVLLFTLLVIILVLAYSTANLSVVLFWPGEIKRLPIGS